MDWKELQQESTENLIDYIKYKDSPDYSELAHAAFAAFTFRYNKEIIDKCRKIGRKWNYDNHTADQIAERCFERFWRYPMGFEKSNCGNLDMENCVRVYLFRIAQNCFFDYSRELLSGADSPYNGTEAVIIEFPSIDHMQIPADKMDVLKEMFGKISAALATLSPKHKTIYLTYKAYEKEGYKLPRNLLKQLREELELAQSSIRVYKNEAFQTVNEYLK